MPLICSSQKAPDWDKWTWLIGNWIGEGKSKKLNPSINSTDKINRANLRPTFSAGSRIRLTKQGFSSQRLTDSR